MEDLELVDKIDKIVLEGIGSPPTHVLIKVVGSVRRSGYLNPILVIRSAEPGTLGNLTYYFAAEPPVGGSPGTPVAIEAQRYLFELQGVKSITVVAASNEMKATV